MKQAVELRVRGDRVPGGEFRLQVGTATSKGGLAVLEGQRDVLRRIADRGEWDVLEAVKAGRVHPAQVARLIDEHGIVNYRARLQIDPPKPERVIPTLDAHVLAWLATIRKHATQKLYARSIAKLTEYRGADGVRLGDLPWHRIPRHVIRDAKASLTVAAMTRRAVMAAWSGFFTWAIDREASEAEDQGREPILFENPVRAAKDWDAVETTRHRFLGWDEFWRWLEASYEPMRAQYAMLTLGGLRIEELLKLPPAHVILPTHVHIGPCNGWAPKGYPRYKHGVRDVPLHHRLVPLLEEYAATYAGAETFFVNPKNGEPWKRHQFTWQMEKDVTAAGLVYGQLTHVDGRVERKPTGITAHTCRHTLASWLAQSDVQLMKIAAILGDTVETVQLHYAHLLPRDLATTLNRVGESDKSPATPKTRGRNGTK